MRKDKIAAALGLLLVPWLLAAAPPAKPIAVVINGVTLPLKSPPLLREGVLFVPVRRTIEALGLAFVKQGNVVTTQVGAKSVSLTIGSRIAHIDGERILLEAPSIEVGDVLYAPLRFFTDVLGAQARFDRRHNEVTIVAELVGRSANGLITLPNGYERFGTVTAVDVVSNPPTITLMESDTVKTIPVSANATIDVEDVNVGVTMPGELGDVRPGDFARVELRKNGRVVRVVDEYGSRNGQIVAVAGNQFVMSDGQVITAGRTTEVALNGRAATFSDLRPGDRVSVRYNVETNEVREVLASRSIPAASAAAGPVRIASVEVGTARALRPGESVEVTLRGTPGGGATFDVGSFATDRPMHETAPGLYVGSYTIPRGADFLDAPVIGHLRVGAIRAADVQAPQGISASSTPPGIADVAPAPGAVVNGHRPAIYATFVSDAVPVDPSSVTLKVDGHDVTADSVRNAQFIEYRPPNPYPNGPVRVTVVVADRAGNTTSRSWTFRIEGHL
jgi:hypothetical protein